MKEKPYDFREIEKKQQKRWKDAELFKTTDDKDKPKFYGLDFFPYPSGAGLSVGHCRNYIPTDVICRYKRMKGFNVLHPMGWDAFGLPAENEAINKKSHPKKTVPTYINTYKRQMDTIGIGYDWSREINSSSPEYYKWTQWIFELLFKRGLAYQDFSPANWCPKCKTVLANEEVVDGLCWRCDTPIEKKQLPQWFFKITEYAERLIDDLDTINWPDSIKLMQKNWIGKSEGAEVTFKSESGEDIVIYTTRPDTLWGVSFMVLAPEHPLVEKLCSPEKREEVAEYRKLAERQSAIDRQSTDEEKTGVFIGAYAISPLDGRKIPIWISDYVMMGYGTGAIMAVPAHDERDFAFACKFGIDILPVIKRVDGMSKTIVPISCDIEDGLKGISFKKDEKYYYIHFAEKDAERVIDLIKGALSEKDFAPVVGTKWGIITKGEFNEWTSFEKGRELLEIVKSFDSSIKAGLLMEYYNTIDFFKDILFHTDKGQLINSDPMVMAFSGSEAKTKVIEYLEERGLGHGTVNFKLRDWLISRQRYWGYPIPIIHCEKCGAVPVPEDQLPVMLPDVENYVPTGDGRSPLANIPEWVNTKCPICGGDAKRETDTMGGFACSSWYFLRFTSQHRDDVPFDKELANYWLPVDLYVGGAEHAVMHLLYARFWTKVLYDAGLIDFIEPFYCLKNQGMVLVETPHKQLIKEDGTKTKDYVPITPEEEAQMDPGDVTYKFTKMSKSKKNVITPDAMAEQFGADSLRVYELFVSPFEEAIMWSNDGMIGASRFVNRVWRILDGYRDRFDKDYAGKIDEEIAQNKEAKSLRRKLHQTIKKLDSDINDFKFNTGIAMVMELLNEMQAFYNKLGETGKSAVFSEVCENLILMLSPIVPHMADEIWEDYGFEGFTLDMPYPVCDEEAAKDDEVEIVIQILGKVRAKISVPADTTPDEMEKLALENETIKGLLEGKTIVKAIKVPKKLVNFVVK
ncbi:MAG: leucine--tRNA ligase [Abditibacteriota bacterium]|nr:leucine--tRNA ligase [Abditibacteriota bacterium]